MVTFVLANFCLFLAAIWLVRSVLDHTSCFKNADILFLCCTYFFENFITVLKKYWKNFKMINLCRFILENHFLKHPQYSKFSQTDFEFWQCNFFQLKRNPEKLEAEVLGQKIVLWSDFIKNNKKLKIDFRCELLTVCKNNKKKSWNYIFPMMNNLILEGLDEKIITVTNEPTKRCLYASTHK
jgi:hypothetical protein